MGASTKMLSMALQPMGKSFAVFCFVCVVVCMVSLQATASPGTALAARQYIERAYNRENQAAQNRSVAASLTDFSPRWYAITPTGGRYSYAMLKQSLSMAYPLQKSVMDTHSLHFLRVSNQEVIVKIKDRTDQLLVDPNTHQPIRLITSSVSIDDWMPTKGRWFHITTKILAIHLTKNGVSAAGP